MVGFRYSKIIRLSSLEAGMGTEFSRTEVAAVRKTGYSQGQSDEGVRAGDQMRRGSGMELSGGGGTSYI